MTSLLLVATVIAFQQIMSMSLSDHTFGSCRYRSLQECLYSNLRLCPQLLYNHSLRLLYLQEPQARSLTITEGIRTIYLVHLQFMYFQYNMYLSNVVHTKHSLLYIHACDTKQS